MGHNIWGKLLHRVASQVRKAALQQGVAGGHRGGGEDPMEPTNTAAGAPACHWGLRAQILLLSEAEATRLLISSNSWVKQLLPTCLTSLIWILLLLLW